jgi:hypothetical protein
MLRDLFVSYRWIDPDQQWVRAELVPQLRQAGLHVLLDVDEDGFVPGRDVIGEMTRAGRECRRTLSVWTPDYFAEDRTVWFESLQARRRDPRGSHSTLLPLLLRHTEIPGEFYGLVYVDWTQAARRKIEWARLLSLLEAPNRDTPPPNGCPSVAESQASASMLSADVAQRQVLASLPSRLSTHDPIERYWIYIALASVGGADAERLLKGAAATESDPFARTGIEDALEILATQPAH